ncbi:multicomponent K+:H+ antiporter subunit D [Allopseudospirillum japonicum]|uniref:Multicomponent K+:H+ antiporter subunit D n=1 Tax=Allopseudospirillum japonicum TaxID=64971 RepID=A0A1H6QZB2_9GAMM|nr:monovalent cation/H+ antiporter subunit D [Allopseudospirillum japonicum]SEI45547.1 multicomponent K+:H+ antiporter subunit D [Allopseudospirillum japonicum]
MSHLITLPILVPMLTGLVMLLPPINTSRTRQRLFAGASLIVQLVLAMALINQATQTPWSFYAMGDWQAPFGIMLMLDRMNALLVMLTSILAFATFLYASAGEDNEGAYFQPLFQFQLMGIQGAFLTGDVFNLFVFFEVLLIASYALLMHGGTKQRTRAGLHYVTLNLVGSALFLFALGILYGTLGTLNMVDMAAKVQHLPEDTAPLVAAGGLLLLVVFGLKAALLPLHFWLPQSYSAAAAPVAALFAIMTKVGLYAIIRIFSLVFGEHAGELAQLAQAWLWPLALLTIAAGILGVLSSQDLRRLVAHLVVISVGSLLAVTSIGNAQALAAVLYYTLHSTLISAALFLLVDMIANQRGKAGSRVVAARPVAQPLALGACFMVAGLSIAGMPPFSGFVGKVMLMQTMPSAGWMLGFWPLALLSGLATLVIFSRAGSTLFWRVHGQATETQGSPKAHWFGMGLLLSASLVLTLWAAELTAYTQVAAQHLMQVDTLIQTLLPLHVPGDLTP